MTGEVPKFSSSMNLPSPITLAAYDIVPFPCPSRSISIWITVHGFGNRNRGKRFLLAEGLCGDERARARGDAGREHEAVEAHAAEHWLPALLDLVVDLSRTLEMLLHDRQRPHRPHLHVHVGRS